MKYALFLLLSITLIVGGFGCHASLRAEPGPLLGNGEWTSRGTPDLTGRWTLLSFFLPTCEGCIREVPELTKVQETYGVQGISVIGVTPVSKVEAHRFAQDMGLPYPVLADAAAELEIYGVREVPDTFLVDPDGVVVARGMELIQEALVSRFGDPTEPSD